MPDDGFFGHILLLLWWGSRQVKGFLQGLGNRVSELKNSKETVNRFFENENFVDNFI